MGSNPAVYWMNISHASFYIFNGKGNKGSQMGHTKKIFKKTLFFNIYKLSKGKKCQHQHPCKKQGVKPYSSCNAIDGSDEEFCSEKDPVEKNGTVLLDHKGSGSGGGHKCKNNEPKIRRIITAKVRIEIWFQQEFKFFKP
jgi:hypothetical protein